MRRSFFAALVVAGALAWAPLPAAAADPLFVNLISDEGHRVTMALAFAKGQQELGHPITIWLNDKAVLVGSKKEREGFGEQQGKLAELLAKGADVIVCPLCMKHYGVGEGDLIEGAQVGNPQLTGNALFREGTRTLTW